MSTYTTTLSALRASVYLKLNETQGGQVFLPDTIDRKLNLKQQHIFRSNHLTFATKARVFGGYTNVTIAEQPTVGDISLKVSSGLSSSGSIWINGNIITYTGLSAGSDYDELTGIPASGEGSLEEAFAVGTTVRPLYALPEDFGYRTRVFVNNKQAIYCQIEDFLLKKTGFTSVQLGSTQYLLFESLNATDEIQMNYQRIPETMTSSVDCSIPDEFAENVLTYSVASEMAQEYGDPDGLTVELQARANFWEKEMQNSSNNQFGARQQLNFNVT